MGRRQLRGHGPQLAAHGRLKGVQRHAVVPEPLRRPPVQIAALPAEVTAAPEADR